MELLVLMIIFLFLFRILESIRLKKVQDKIFAPKKCPPHKWSYDITGRMFCDACKNRPFTGDLE